jgi:hypothetical protein
MRKSVMLIVGLAALMLIVGHVPANAVKLSQQQVETVCGKNLQSNGGHSGCDKACGASGEHRCVFDCSKSGCTGSCITCKPASTGKDNPAHVVNQLLRKQ